VHNRFHSCSTYLSKWEISMSTPYMTRSHITDLLSERPITSLQTVLQVSGDPIPPFLLRLPRDRNPPIERLHGEGRGPAMTGVGKRGALICLLDLAARFSNPHSVIHQHAYIHNTGGLCGRTHRVFSAHTTSATSHCSQPLS
jgi:hypothetical protein